MFFFFSCNRPTFACSHSSARLDGLFVDLRQVGVSQPSEPSQVSRDDEQHRVGHYLTSAPLLLAGKHWDCLYRRVASSKKLLNRLPTRAMSSSANLRDLHSWQGHTLTSIIVARSDAGTMGINYRRQENMGRGLYVLTQNNHSARALQNM